MIHQREETWFALSTPHFMHLKVMGILYAHFLLKEKEKGGLGDPARSQPQGRGGSPRLNTGVADTASGAPRLLMLEPAVSVTVLALVFT